MSTRYPDVDRSTGLSFTPKALHVMVSPSADRFSFIPKFFIWPRDISIGTLHVSNVMVVHDGRTTRIGYKKLESGLKVRIASKTDEEIG